MQIVRIETNEIFRNRKDRFPPQISAIAKSVDSGQELPAGQEQGIVDNDKIPTIGNQRTHFIDQGKGVVFKVNDSFHRLRKKRRIQNDAVKEASHFLQPANDRKKIADNEIFSGVMKGIHGTGTPGQSQKFF